jgi:SAM-dependent methyltransferase
MSHAEPARRGVVESGIRSLARFLRVERSIVELGHRLNAGQHWCRVVMDGSINDVLSSLDTASLDAVEVSGTAHQNRGWRSYASLEYPAFDLCEPPEPLTQFDVVVCEQVLEHVVDPSRAARTLHDVARPGGMVIVSTPFLLRIHESPGDFWRFTPAGLARILEGAGLDVAAVHSWGNAPCVRGNFRRWRAYRPWHSLRNEAGLPVVVWAFAYRPPTG